MQRFAAVAVDVPLLHLDRPFDYSIPEQFSQRVGIGTKVKVRFGGRLITGIVVGFTETPERLEKTLPIADVVGEIPLLTTETLQLCRSVADRWIGTLHDVIRVAVPPRQVRVENSVLAALPVPASRLTAVPAETWAWREFDASQHLHAALASPSERPVRWVAHCPPDAEWHSLMADALVTAASAGAAIGIVADARTLAVLESALLQHVDRQDFAIMTADLPPAARYREFLRVLRGEVRLVIGTRSAVFAPVQDLTFMCLYDDADDSLAEQHAPSWHAREVMALRTRDADISCGVISSSRSTETQMWVEAGWAISIEKSRDEIRKVAPKVRTTNDVELAKDPLARAARLPQVVFATIREGLESGPVLIHVPRRGYQLHLACGRCRNKAACKHCQGPLSKSSASSVLQCMWCGATEGEFCCPWCQSTTVRSHVIGAARTAEELGRAFPETVIITSGKDMIKDLVPNAPAVVIATPGAEPRVEDGRYSAAVILDSEMALSRVGLRTHEETLRRWLNVAALVTPASGRIAITGDDSHPVVQALVRHDPVGFAHRELASRRSAMMLPAFSVAEIIATAGTTSARLREVSLPPGARVLGPVPMGMGVDNIPRERTLVCSARNLTPAVSAELRAAVARKLSTKSSEIFSVRIDPVDLR